MNINYFNDKGQCLSKFYMHTSSPPHLAKMEALIQKVWGGDHEILLSKISQVKMLFSLAPRFD